MGSNGVLLVMPDKLKVREILLSLGIRAEDIFSSNGFVPIKN
jgi:hypothetical protein